MRAAVARVTLVAFAATCAAPPLTAQQPAPAAKPAAAPEGRSPGEETPWPTQVAAGNDTRIALYQPQVDSWDGFTLVGRMAARADVGKDKPQPHFGILAFSARTMTDKGSRTVIISDARISKVDFPSATMSKAGNWKDAITRDFDGKTRSIALDRLEANLAVVQAEKTLSRAPLRNDPPRIVFSDVPALLVPVDGEAVLRDVPGTGLKRVINARPLLVQDAAGAWWLKVFDGWMSAGKLEGPWVVAKPVSSDLDKAYRAAMAAHTMDPLTGQGASDQPAPRLAQRAPAIFVSTKPTELIVTEGPAQYAPIEGTRLLYVSNTTGNVFTDTTDSRTYVLSAGRWFAGDLKGGGWTYIAPRSLPADFQKIPDESPKENVKASIPGTAQAREAAIAADIPQVAAVKISGTAMAAPKIDGAPALKQIDGTALQYVANSPTPIIRTPENTYYSVQNGVWFVSVAANGPWTVATVVPAVIYTIPPSSPLHYVTYVRIYGTTPTVVYVGYTPGYQGTYVDPVTGLVVYGTGYLYDPWIGTYWYGYPVTYGYGAAVAYTPWTGWAVAFGLGWMWGAATVAWGWGWGPCPYWGPWAHPAWYGAAFGPRGGAVAWGPGGWAGYTGNIYSQWGNRAQVSRYNAGFDAWTGNAWAGKAGASYNSRTGIATAGQRGAVANVYTGNYAAGSRGAASGKNYTAVGQRGTAGNAYTGDHISGNRGAVINKSTGEVTRFGGITGEGGGHVGHIGDDVYAGKDGNVYRNTGNGWEKHDAGGGWGDVSHGINQGATTRDATGGLGSSRGEFEHLDRERSARDAGSARTNQLHASVGAARGFHGGGLRRR